MGDHVEEVIAASAQDNRRAKIAVWVDTEINGCNTASAACIQKLANKAELHAVPVSSADIASGALVDGSFSALAIGGGELAAVRALGSEGFEAIREFCRGGKGYVGFCLGAHLAGRDLLHLCETTCVKDLVLSGCFDGSFCDHHDFGNPEDRTWMISGAADLLWNEAEDAQLPKPVEMMVSHPPAMELTGDSDAVKVLARFGECKKVEWYAHGPKCPLTDEQFQNAVETSLSGKVAFASTGRIIIAAAHPEMSGGTDNEELTKAMLLHAVGAFP
jgi:hypothetical protein